MGLFLNAAGTHLIVNGSGNPIDCTTCPCTGFGRCEDFCDPLGPEEYTVQFEGTLGDNGCADCDTPLIGVQFVLTFTGVEVCGDFTCCWGYSDPGCDLVIILVVQNNLVILTVLIGVLIEAQWVWDRGASTSCTANDINNNITYDTGDEIQCTGWNTLSWTIT